jgi:hypothetical protein
MTESGHYENGECVRREDYSSAIQFMNEKNAEFAKVATAEKHSMAMRPKLVDI